jgi:hypothetical protein
MGFGDALHMDNCSVPRSFVQWVADNVSTDEEIIRIGCKSIELSPQSVVDSLGTPIGGIPVDSDEENGKVAFLALFGLIEVLSIRFFGKKIWGKSSYLMVFLSVFHVCLPGHILLSYLKHKDQYKVYGSFSCCG